MRNPPSGMRLHPIRLFYFYSTYFYVLFQNEALKGSTLKEVFKDGDNLHTFYTILVWPFSIEDLYNGQLLKYEHTVLQFLIFVCKQWK